MLPQDFYRTQSEMSNPGKYVYLYNALPEDLDKLCQMVRNVYVHYMSPECTLPLARKAEIDTRRCDLILARIAELDAHLLDEPRPHLARFVGCCRDAALLLCSMLRHQGIPARLRAGFMTYFHFADAPDFKPDHVVVEYYDSGRWKLVDAELASPTITDQHGTFDVQNIPRDRFLVGGAAWQACRNGQTNADNFGVSPSETFWRGLWAIRSRMVDDLAMLNKTEYLLWDGWGLKDYDAPSEDELRLLDQVAVLTTAAQDDTHFDALQEVYTHKRLHAPRTIMSFSPIQGERYITLD